MNSKNSETSDPHLLDKINLKRKNEYAALSNISIHYT